MKRNQSKANSVVSAVIVVVAALWFFGSHHGGASLPGASASHGANLIIVSQSTKDAGIGDGTMYDYVTIKNTGTSLKSYVGINGSCTNDAGVVVGTGIGNTGNVGPGEETVVTVIFMNVPDCRHVTARFDSLTD